MPVRKLGRLRGAPGILPVQWIVGGLPASGPRSFWSVGSFSRNGARFASQLWGCAWVRTLFKLFAKTSIHTTFGSVMLTPPCGRSISALFFALIAPSNAGILRSAQNDRRWGYPLRMTEGAYRPVFSLISYRPPKPSRLTQRGSGLCLWTRSKRAQCGAAVTELGGETGVADPN
jgi:hypothetical protein